MADSVCETKKNSLSTEAIESSKRSLDTDAVVNSCKDVNTSPHTKSSSESVSELEEINKKLKYNNRSCNDENSNDNDLLNLSITKTPVEANGAESMSPAVTSSLNGLSTNLTSLYNLPLDFYSFLTEYERSLEKEASAAKNPGDIFSDYKPHAYTEVVFRRKRNHNLAEKFFQIYGMYNKSHKLKLCDVEPEIFDWILQHLEQKNCPYSLAVALAFTVSKDCVKQIVNRQSQEKQQQQQEQQEENSSHPNNGDISNCFVSDSNPIGFVGTFDEIKKESTQLLKDIIHSLLSGESQHLLSLADSLYTGPFVSIASDRNTRRTMEDRHVIIHDLNKVCQLNCTKQYSYYAVFDGHVGIQAASYCAAQLHRHFVENQAFQDGDIVDALKVAFAKCDAGCLERTVLGEEKTGTTAVVCVKEDNSRLYFAWAGDSQAILVASGESEDMTPVHKPSDESERKRILDMGGNVIYADTWRVAGVLAVSRAIGDPDHKPYVTSDPDTRVYDLKGTEDFIVIASDGLWDSFTPDDVASHVFEYLATNSDSDPDEAAGKISSYLVDKAKREGSTDNITVIVVFLRDIKKLLPTFTSEATGNFFEISDAVTCVAANQLSSARVDVDESLVDDSFVTARGSDHENNPRNTLSTFSALSPDLHGKIIDVSSFDNVANSPFFPESTFATASSPFSAHQSPALIPDQSESADRNEVVTPSLLEPTPSSPFEYHEQPQSLLITETQVSRERMREQSSEMINFDSTSEIGPVTSTFAESTPSRPDSVSCDAAYQMSASKFGASDSLMGDVSVPSPEPHHQDISRETPSPLSSNGEQKVIDVSFSNNVTTAPVDSNVANSPLFPESTFAPASSASAHQSVSVATPEPHHEHNSRDTPSPQSTNSEQKVIDVSLSNNESTAPADCNVATSPFFSESTFATDSSAFSAHQSPALIPDRPESTDRNEVVTPSLLEPTPSSPFEYHEQPQSLLLTETQVSRERMREQSSEMINFDSNSEIEPVTSTLAESTPSRPDSVTCDAADQLTSSSNQVVSSSMEHSLVSPPEADSEDNWKNTPPAASTLSSNGEVKITDASLFDEVSVTPSLSDTALVTSSALSIDQSPAIIKHESTGDSDAVTSSLIEPTPSPTAVCADEAKSPISSETAPVDDLPVQAQSASQLSASPSLVSHVAPIVSKVVSSASRLKSSTTPTTGKGGVAATKKPLVTSSTRKPATSSTPPSTAGRTPSAKATTAPLSRPTRSVTSSTSASATSSLATKARTTGVTSSTASKVNGNSSLLTKKTPTSNATGVTSTAKVNGVTKKSTSTAPSKVTGVSSRLYPGPKTVVTTNGSLGNGVGPAVPKKPTLSSVSTRTASSSLNAKSTTNATSKPSASTTCTTTTTTSSSLQSSRLKSTASTTNASSRVTSTVASRLNGPSKSKAPSTAPASSTNGKVNGTTGVTKKVTVTGVSSRLYPGPKTATSASTGR